MKNFDLNVTARLLLLVILIILTVLAFHDDRIYINRFILIGFDILVFTELLRYLRHTNRKLTQFVNALRHQDSTMSFGGPSMGKTFDSLHKSFQDIILEFRERRSEEKSNDQFLEMAFDRLNVGVITLSEDNTIVQMNIRALEFLHTEKHHSLSALALTVPEFAEAITRMSDPGHQTLEISLGEQPAHFSIRTARMHAGGKQYRLITFQDIGEALDRREIESWTRLIRILTHEIMNSVTPIASLSETMNNLLTTEGQLKRPEQLTGEQLEDLSFSLQTIGRRSEGLLSFVEDYRKFTRVTVPSKTVIQTRSFVHDVLSLMRNDLGERGVLIEQEIPETSRLWADQNLIEQVLINLLKNAAEALENHPAPQIRIRQHRTEKTDILEIADNGPGISAEELREIFVPFFTTKQNGSGIGLSLTRQILHMHGGTIKVDSVVNKGTVCKLFLPFKKAD